jgi:hypothetical protein
MFTDVKREAQFSFHRGTGRRRKLLFTAELSFRQRPLFAIPVFLLLRRMKGWTGTADET